MHAMPLNILSTLGACHVTFCIQIFTGTKMYMDQLGSSMSAVSELFMFQLQEQHRESDASLLRKHCESSVIHQSR